MRKTPYQIRIQLDGSASAATIYGDKIPVGKIAVIESMGVLVYTTNPGDYTTAKFIFLGFEHEGQTCFVEGGDINATNTMKGMISTRTPFVINEGDRVMSYVEATSASQTYVLVATGWLIDVGDL